MDGRVDGWIDVLMADGGRSVRMDGGVDGWMDGWMDGCMMDVCAFMFDYLLLACTCLCTCFHFCADMRMVTGGEGGGVARGVVVLWFAPALGLLLRQCLGRLSPESCAMLRCFSSLGSQTRQTLRVLEHMGPVSLLDFASRPFAGARVGSLGVCVHAK